MIKAVLSGIALVFMLGGSALPASPARGRQDSTPGVAGADTLQALRAQGDIGGQRRHVWDLIGYVTHTAAKTGHAEPFFETWHGEGELFSTATPGPRGIRGFSRTSPKPSDSNSQTADVPVLTYTLYNDAAYEHILRNHLNETAELNRLRKTGILDKGIAGDRSVPPFPANAIVLKTVWWPVAKKGLTALPVWDPARNAPRPNGNPYSSWQRVVAVDPSGRAIADATVATDFAGSSFPHARRIGLETFYHVAVDARMAERMMRDPETRKAVLIALGRPLRSGDYLALVSANLAAREVPDWVWATFWWHDQPLQGPFAADRPGALEPVWTNYLMQTAFDAEKPVENGSPHIAFNPWLEGRFPDGGHGNGMTSNCMACHQRASYPSVAFLPVTRGSPDLHNDPAFAPGRLRTSLLWSLAMHAKP
jgi:hypothetical protein